MIVETAVDSYLQRERLLLISRSMFIILDCCPQGEEGPLKNRGTGMCVGVGKDVYAGKYLQQYDCDDVSTFKFAEADKLKIGM